jgi:hypothetical protein
MSLSTSKKQRSHVMAFALFLLFPAVAFAQLPTPTYGWNLGNTLEPPAGEGAWGPAATQKLINAVTDAGFNTVRLPVAWDSHANQSTLQIDPAWRARATAVGASGKTTRLPPRRIQSQAHFASPQCVRAGEPVRDAAAPK